LITISHLSKFIIAEFIQKTEYSFIWFNLQSDAFTSEFRSENKSNLQFSIAES
jgi:hypothetical protein